MEMLNDILFTVVKCSITRLISLLERLDLFYGCDLRSSFFFLHMSLLKITIPCFIDVVLYLHVALMSLDGNVLFMPLEGTGIVLLMFKNVL
jgi:hypothetical protein